MRRDKYTVLCFLAIFRVYIKYEDSGMYLFSSDVHTKKFVLFTQLHVSLRITVSGSCPSNCATTPTPPFKLSNEVKVR